MPFNKEELRFAIEEEELAWIDKSIRSPSSPFLKFQLPMDYWMMESQPGNESRYYWSGLR